MPLASIGVWRKRQLRKRKASTIGESSERRALTLTFPELYGGKNISPVIRLTILPMGRNSLLTTCRAGFHFGELSTYDLLYSFVEVGIDLQKILRGLVEMVGRLALKQLELLWKSCTNGWNFIASITSNYCSRIAPCASPCMMPGHSFDLCSFTSPTSIHSRGSIHKSSSRRKHVIW